MPIQPTTGAVPERPSGLRTDHRAHRGIGAGELEALRERRLRLRTALTDLESALARPTTEPGRWRERVLISLRRLAADLEAHVRDTEAPGGFLEQVLTEAPWLSPRVRELRREHAHLSTEATAAVSTVEGSAGVATVRSAAEGLARDVERHRHRGAELLLDAYELDLGAAD